jgi:hypothetical protein
MSKKRYLMRAVSARDYRWNVHMDIGQLYKFERYGDRHTC